jgi:hypothetical protein
LVALLNIEPPPAPLRDLAKQAPASHTVNAIKARLPLPDQIFHDKCWDKYRADHTGKRALPPAGRVVLLPQSPSGRIKGRRCPNAPPTRRLSLSHVETPQEQLAGTEARDAQRVAQR